MKSLILSAFVLLLSVSAFATSSTVDFVEVEGISMEMASPSADVVVNEAEEADSCTFTTNITVTDSDGNSTTYQGTVTVSMSCKDAIKAFASA